MLGNCLGVEVEVGRGRHCESFIPQEFPYKGNKLHSLEGERTEVLFCSFYLISLPLYKERNVLYFGGFGKRNQTHEAQAFLASHGVARSQSMCFFSSTL